MQLEPISIIRIKGLWQAGILNSDFWPFDMLFGRPFDRIMVLSNVEGFSPE